MEHITEAFYEAAAAGVFVLALSLMLYTGSCIDRLYAGRAPQGLAGSVLSEECADE